MAMRAKKKTYTASISVLLSLSLFLILSLLLVLLESARVNAMRAMVTLNLQSSLEAVLSNYYEPLFNDYGIYGLYDVQLEEELADCMEAAASPLADLPEFYTGAKDSSFAFSYDLSDIKVCNETDLLDGGGQIVAAQMMEAGAVDGIEIVAEKLLEAVHLLDDAEETATLLQEKMAVEQQLAYMDMELLALMQAVDGAPVAAGGFVVDKNGNYVCGTRFVKRLVPGAVSKESVLLQANFYESLKERYVDGWVLLAQMNSLGEQAATQEESLVLLREKEVELRLLLASCKEAAQKGLAALEKLLVYQEQAAPLVAELERTLKAGEELLGESLFSSCMEELATMKKYAGMTLSTEGYDFAAMQQTLLKNLQCLEQLEEAYVTYDKGGYPGWSAGMKAAQRIFRDYSFDSFQLDYSEIRGTVVLTDTSGWDALVEFLLKGIDSYLFTGEEELSYRAIYDWNLPSKNVSGGAEDLYRLPKLTEEDLQDTEFVQEYLQGDALGGIRGFLLESTERIGEKLLLVAYMHTHFGNYTEQEQGVLLYQQEYLLFGSMRDISNVRQCAYSLLGLRLLLNIIYAFTDPVLNSKAAAYATELVGGFGLPFLIVVCQTILLFVCGVQNALLETVELLQGKQVPLLVTTSSFQISMEESFFMGKTALHAKAAAYRGGSGFCLTYSHYLLLFMLPANRERLTYRAMDLIQENLQLYHDPDFQFSKCIHSFGATVTVRYQTKYAGLLFTGDRVLSPRELLLQEKAAAGY